ncbi:MAPEG family protein [Rhizobium sp. PDO1-076]|uniref:MAPEG family protein n=1 Tax=Rhizobium sp. PDO1-076 TaxID=1125979 RepID=UPI0002EAC031|nr:MAPEG family protein [Rhizobium sp. PDO1-076]
MVVFRMISEQVSMRFTILATFAALMTYCWFMIKVARARKQFGVEAPKTSGNQNFERIFRVQQNTVEQLVLFLPALWIFGFYVSDQLAGLLGLGWTAARALYAAEYYTDAKKRGPGAALTTLIGLVLLVGGTIGALVKMG